LCVIVIVDLYRMTKKLLITLVFFGWASLAIAQLKPPTVLNDPDYDFESRLRFGFSLGLNVMDFQITSNTNQAVSANQETTPYFVDNSQLIPGFNVNVISDFQLVPTLSLRFMPGLAFGHRDLSFYNPKGELKRVIKLESSFIEMPLSLKYSAKRKSNTRPYLIAGANYRLDMAAYKKLNPSEGVVLRLAKGDLYYEFGFGLDYFLAYFKFSTELKFSSGIFNVFTHDYVEGTEDYANAIKVMRSQLVTLSFHFE
jgi:hypothetical protein